MQFHVLVLYFHVSVFSVVFWVSILSTFTVSIAEAIILGILYFRFHPFISLYFSLRVNKISSAEKKPNDAIGTTPKPLIKDKEKKQIINLNVLKVQFSVKFCNLVVNCSMWSIC